MVTALKPVQSSMIAAHGYDLSSRALSVKFNNSALVHVYKDVEPEVAEKFAAGESIGKAFNALIRDKYEHTVVGEEDEVNA